MICINLEQLCAYTFVRCYVAASWPRCIWNNY